MKSAVETLNPTRVKLTVEVPFEELKPSLDARVQADRRAGHRSRASARARCPPRSSTSGSAARRCSTRPSTTRCRRPTTRPSTSTSVKPLGQPEVDVTEFKDGEPLKFTAEVDVRPEIELPDYDGIEVTVDDAEVTDEDVDEQLDALREPLRARSPPVERAAGDGDFVTIDLAATVDGEPIEDARASGLSYEVGSGQLLDGLDEAITGLSAGEHADVPAQLDGGELRRQGRRGHRHRQQSVKERELPELRRRLRPAGQRVRHPRRAQGRPARAGSAGSRSSSRASQARDKVLEALLAAVEVPLPEKRHRGRRSTTTSSDGPRRRRPPRASSTDAGPRVRSSRAVRARRASRQGAAVGQRGRAHPSTRPPGAALRHEPDQFAQELVQSGQVPPSSARSCAARRSPGARARRRSPTSRGEAVDLAALDRDELTSGDDLDEDDYDDGDDSTAPDERRLTLALPSANTPRTAGWSRGCSSR